MTIPYDDIFFDTNILIYAHLVKSPFHDPALKWLQSCTDAGINIWISRQVMRKYLSAMTRPNALTDKIDLDSLVNDIREFEQRFTVAEDSFGITNNLLSLLTEIEVSGKQIHDANLVATMLSYGVGHLLTHNISDFKRFSDRVSIIPLLSDIPSLSTEK